MLSWERFRGSVATVIVILDSVEMSQISGIVRFMGIESFEAIQVLQKMGRAGLVVVDTQPGIVAITPKGRALAAEIRSIIGKVVKP